MSVIAINPDSERQILQKQNATLNSLAKPIFVVESKTEIEHLKSLRNEKHNITVSETTTLLKVVS